MNAGVTLSVAHAGLGDFLRMLLLEFSSSEAGLPLGSMDLGSGGVYGDGSIGVDDVTVSGGFLQSPVFTMTSVAPVSAAGDGAAFTVDLTIAGNAVYSDWAETTTTSHYSSSGAGGSHSSTDHYSGFSFPLESLPLTLTVAFGVSGDEIDPEDTASVLTVAMTGASAGAAVFGTGVIPSDSAMNEGDFFGAFPSNGPEILAGNLKAADVVTPLVEALNTLFKAIPDSGKLTPDLTFLFPPTGFAFPTGGGFQLAVTGKVETGTNVLYPGPDPKPLGFPPMPQTGITFAVNEYVLDEALWYAAQAKTLDVSLPPAGAPAGDWNTEAYHVQLPWLWDFAPASEMTVTLTCDPASPPTFSFTPAWQASRAVLVVAGVPASVLASLTPAAGPDYTEMIFATSDELAAMLGNALTPADAAAWTVPTVAAAAGHGLALTTPYRVEIGLTRHGAAGVVGTFDLTLMHWLDTLSLISDPRAGKQTLRFTSEYENFACTNSVGAAGLTFTDPEAVAFYSTVLSSGVDAVSAALSAAGQTGVAVPALPGFVMSGTVLTVLADQIQVTGDTTDPTTDGGFVPSSAAINKAMAGFHPWNGQVPTD